VYISLRCRRCPCQFSAPADAPAPAILERMNEDAPWFALAEGETFAAMVRAALERRGKILCPDCRGEVLIGGPAPSADEGRRKRSPGRRNVVGSDTD
jgi:hypothetical protein